MITLLTDFGSRDGYVAAVKGVIASIAPDVGVVDICHEIEPQNIRRAGMVWASAIPYFPSGAIHVGVVDPGVGTRRKILAIRSKAAIFLVPDNGLIGYVLARRQIRDVYRVKDKSLFLDPVSHTFHGRDIFAPVAARLAQGMPLEKVGPRVGDWCHGGLPRPRTCRVDTVLEIRGEVVDIDRFGNAVTNITPPASGSFVDLRAGAFTSRVLRRTYGNVKPGRPLVLLGSTGHVEIAVARGRADQRLSLTVGERVVCRWKASAQSHTG